MANLFICENCGAKFAKLERLQCQTCGQYKCPACSRCYCDYDTKNIKTQYVMRTDESEISDYPIFSTVEYAKYLINKNNLQMKGYLEYTGQRNVYSDKYRKNMLISDFMFYDNSGTIPLRIFGPIPSSYFKYRFAMNKVLLEGITIRLFKGEFELLLNSKGKITLLKEKQSQPLLKYIEKEAEKAKV